MLTEWFLQQGKGLVKVNGKPLSLVEPQILRFKVYEPILLLGTDKFGEFSPQSARASKNLQCLHFEHCNICRKGAKRKMTPGKKCC